MLRAATDCHGRLKISQVFFRRESILLPMGSASTPMSSKARSVFLETCEKAAFSLDFFQTAASSAAKGNLRFRALEKKGFLFGSLHSLTASTKTSWTGKTFLFCSPFIHLVMERERFFLFLDPQSGMDGSQEILHVLQKELIPRGSSGFIPSDSPREAEDGLSESSSSTSGAPG